MFKVEPDLHNPALTYIYEETDSCRRFVMTVVRDIDLSRQVVEWLNNREENKE